MGYHGLMDYVDKRAAALEEEAQAQIHESVSVKQLSSEAANDLLSKLFTSFT